MSPILSRARHPIATSSIASSSIAGSVSPTSGVLTALAFDFLGVSSKVTLGAFVVLAFVVFVVFAVFDFGFFEALRFCNCAIC